MRVTMVDAKVDLSDVLEALSPDDIVELLADLEPKKFDEILRRRSNAPEPNPLSATIDAAIDLLRAGRGDDALLLLEREAHPKWPSLADFERDHKQAAGA